MAPFHEIAVPAHDSIGPDEKPQAAQGENLDVLVPNAHRQQPLPTWWCSRSANQWSSSPAARATM